MAMAGSLREPAILIAENQKMFIVRAESYDLRGSKVEQLTTVQQCAENKFINQYLKLPETVGKPTGGANDGFVVEVTFRDRKFSGSLITSITVSRIEIDTWITAQRKREGHPLG